MSRNGLIRKRRVVPKVEVKMNAYSLSVALFLLIASPTFAQNFEPAGTEAGSRIAIDRSMTFRRDDGLVQSVVLTVPPQTSRDVRYALLTADFDCGKGGRKITSRTEFSSRRDPVHILLNRSPAATFEIGPQIAEQVQVVCASGSRTGSVSLFEFVGGREALTN